VPVLAPAVGCEEGFLGPPLVVVLERVQSGLLGAALSSIGITGLYISFVFGGSMAGDICTPPTTLRPHCAWLQQGRQLTVNYELHATRMACDSNMPPSLGCSKSLVTGC
jgi:hypothetical protein